MPLRRRAGLEECRFHDLRHTCATLLLLANVHPKVVSERLGHAKIEITLNIYSHLIPAMQEKAVEALEVALAPPKGSPTGVPAEGAADKRLADMLSTVEAPQLQ